MLFKVKFASAIYCAAVVLASPSALIPRDVSVVTNASASLQNFTDSISEWNGTRAGLKPLNLKIYDATQLTYKIYKEFQTIDAAAVPSYYTSFESFIRDTYNRSGDAAITLATKAKAAGITNNNDTWAYWEGLSVTIHYTARIARENAPEGFEKVKFENLENNFTTIWNKDSPILFDLI